MGISQQKKRDRLYFLYFLEWSQRFDSFPIATLQHSGYLFAYSISAAGWIMSTHSSMRFDPLDFFMRNRHSRTIFYSLSCIEYNDNEWMKKKRSFTLTFYFCRQIFIPWAKILCSCSAVITKFISLSLCRQDVAHLIRHLNILTERGKQRTKVSLYLFAIWLIFIVMLRLL